MSVKTVTITTTRPKIGDVAVPSSTGGVPREPGPLGEHAESRGAEENTKVYTEVVRPSAEVPGLRWPNLKRLEGKDPVAAALSSVVSSLPPSITRPIPGVELGNTKVKAWRRAAMKGEGNDRA